MRRHLLLSLGMSYYGTLASPCKPSIPNLPSTTVISRFSSSQLGGSTSSTTASTLASTAWTSEETTGGSTILISLSTDSTSASIKTDLESLLSATTASSTESLSTSALPSLSVPSSTASTDSESSIWKSSATSETAMISLSSVETYSTSHLSTTLITSIGTTSTDTESTNTVLTIITLTSVPTSDTIIESIATSTTGLLSTLPISSIHSISSHATDSGVLSTSQEKPSSSAISSMISSTTESFLVSAIDSTTITTTIPTSSDTTTSSPASTSSVAPLLFKAIVQDGPAALTLARVSPTGTRAFSIGSFWANVQSSSAHKEATLTIDPITGQLMLSDGIKVCAQYDRNRESARVRACAPTATQQDSYITCDLGSKPGDLLQCKAPLLSCIWEDGITSCQSTERENTKFYALSILSGYWALYIGPADHTPDNMVFGLNFLIEKI